MCSCGDDHEYVPSGRHIYAGGSEELTVTRRDVLKGGVAAAVATGAAALFGQPIAAQAPAGAGAQAPGAGASARGGPIFWGNNNAGNIDSASILAERQGPTKTTGLKFKALVRYGTTLSTETLTLLPLHPLHVVVRMQACQTCYSTTGQMTGKCTERDRHRPRRRRHRRGGRAPRQARETRRSSHSGDDAELRCVPELP